ncbi:MAG: hypothetical protein WBC73_16425 [Phormidesmis sp.]
MRSTLTYRLPSNQAYWPLRLGTTSKHSRRGLALQLRDLLETLATQLRGSTEPYVWESKDASGQTVWNAEDRVSGSVIRHASETEIRIWLEERHYTA